MLTSKQLVQEGIITNVSPECVAQVGIDLQVKDISRVVGRGFVPKEGKTVLPDYQPVQWENDEVTLSPGVYEVVFYQGCNFPNNVAGNIVHRSSVLRCGCLLVSAEFDPGFHTENIGSFLTVTNSIKIQRGARLGQIVCYRTEQEAEKYNGQWQNDIQRKN